MSNLPNLKNGEVKNLSKRVPTFDELYKPTDDLEGLNELQVLLNRNPPKEWLVKHKHLNIKVNDVWQPYFYLPIERIKWLLTRIFITHNVETKEIKLLANSVSAIVRLHYRNPVTGLMEFQDGTGAAALQTDSGAGAIEFDKLKNNAVQLAAPAAESYAVKNAAKKIGRLFGLGLNGGVDLAYEQMSGRFLNVQDTSQDEEPEKEVKLPELTPDHEKWKGAINAIKKGTQSIESIKKYFIISKENEKLLCK